MPISQIILRDIGTGAGDTRARIFKNSVTPPLASTLPGLRDGTRDSQGGGGGGVVTPPDYTPVGLLGTETFDGQADWTSSMHSTEYIQKARDGATLPTGWDSRLEGGEWHPENGNPDQHPSLEILASNSAKARGGTGKSAVFWRESYSKGWKNWHSDSQLAKILDDDLPEFCIEFYISFSDEWWSRTNTSNFASKLVRFGSWSRQGSEFEAFEGGQQGPLFLWDYKRDAYGLRNMVSFRGGPHGENYRFNGEWDLKASRDFTNDTVGHGFGGGTPQIPDLVNGGFISDNLSQTVDHAQILGPTSATWTKVAFYVKMNSAIGTFDGVIKQFINDEQILHVTDIPWVQENVENKMAGWNFFSIGGNSYFQAYPNEDKYEEWYSIDDVSWYDQLPEHLTDG